MAHQSQVRYGDASGMTGEGGDSQDVIGGEYQSGHRLSIDEDHVQDMDMSRTCCEVHGMPSEATSRNPKRREHTCVSPLTLVVCW